MDGEQNPTTAPPAGTGQQPAPQFTQGDVDRIAGKARDDGRQAAINELMQKYGDLEQLANAAKRLRELEDAQKSEQEKLAEQVAALRAQVEQEKTAAQSAQLEALRLEIGQEKGLSPVFARRLQGTTREELEADADAMLKAMQPESGRIPNNDATAGGQQTRKSNRRLTPEQQAAARRAGISEEKYLESLALIEGE